MISAMLPKKKQIDPQDAQVKALSTKLLELGTQTTNTETGWRRHQQEGFEDASSQHGFISRNAGNGIMCLGVVSHPDVPNRIWKIVVKDSKDAYLMYARWVFENRVWESNRHAPRIYDIVDGGEVVLINMEELSELDWDTAPNYLKNDWTVVKASLNPRPSHPFLMTNQLQRDRESEFIGTEWFDPEHTNRQLETYCQTLFEEFKYEDIFWDVHKGNVMLRGEILVVTDPMVFNFT